MNTFRSRIKTVIFLLTINVILLLLMLIVGEFALRWYVEGGFRLALDSIVSRRTPEAFLGTDNWLIHDAELGYIPNPRRNGVNSLGIRHPEISPEKPDGLFRIIVLGDSVAWDSHGFVTLLRDRLGPLRHGPIEIINAAVPGYTTYQERRLLERDLLPLNPDLVILQYCLNDNHRFLHRLTNDGKWLITQKAKHALLSEGQSWLARLSRASYLLLEIRRRVLKWYMRSSGKFPWEGREDFTVAWQDNTWPAFKEHLLSMRNALIHHGARFAIVVVPFGPQLQKDLLDSDRTYTLKPQRLLLNIATRADVPVLDLFPAFLANRHKKLYRGDGIHLSPIGHELVAQQLLTFIERQSLLMHN